jgi:hypothetical protein
VAKLKYLVKTVINQNLIHEETENKLYLDNTHYHSVLNLLYSSQLSKNTKIKTYKNNFACSFVWVCNLVSDIKERMYTEGIWEQGAVENIWTEER